MQVSMSLISAVCFDVVFTPVSDFDVCSELFTPSVLYTVHRIHCTNLW